LGSLDNCHRSCRFLEIVLPVVVDCIKKQPETDNAIQAILKFLIDGVQQAWFSIAALDIGWLVSRSLAGRASAEAGWFLC
jgi:hypothetical protein